MIIQQALPTMELSEEDLMQIAMSEPLDKKIEKAILFYKLHQPEYQTNSGGKDSTVNLQLAKEAGVDSPTFYNCTTIDPPELIRFLKSEYKNTIWNRPSKHLMTRMIEKMLIPTRQMRWCCAEYKECGGKGKNRCVGVRAEESPRRKGLWRQILKHTDGGIIYSPILYWTEEDIWNFIHDRKLPYCSLYDEGFKRIGCVACPLASTKQQLLELERFPKFKDMWHKAFKTMFNNRFNPNKKGGLYSLSKCKSVDDLWGIFLGNKADKEDDCQGVFMLKQIGG